MGSRFNLKLRCRTAGMSYFKLLDHVNREMRHPVKSFESFRHGMRVMLSFLGKQCSPIVGQRIARGYRVLLLHSKLWSNHAASLTKGTPNSKRWVLGLVMYSLCHPKFNIIEDDELNAHKNDLDYIHELTAATVVCPHCKDRLVINKKLPDIKYCHCPGAETAYNRKIDSHPWAPFVETHDLLIWRKPNPDFDGLYTYKVYGYYDDITPEDFLQTQLDLEYRKKWDNLVLQLRIIDRDVDSSSEVVHWEMKWPKMFSNRDYCYVRRHLVDEEEKTIVIISKAVKHPNCPEVKGVVRVREYWSIMQIKAVKGMNDRGVEFGLTYFDNPGLSLPTWLSNWAAMAGIPDFLNKVRVAARMKRAELNKTLSEVILKEPIPVEKIPESDVKGAKSDLNSNVEVVPNQEEQQQQESSTNNNKSSEDGSKVTDAGSASDCSSCKSRSGPTSTTTVKASSTITSNVNVNGNSGATGEQGEILSQFFKENFLTPPTSLNDG